MISPLPTGPRRSRALAALALAAALAAVPAIGLMAAPAGPGAQVIDGARAQVRALEGELVRLGDEAGAAAAAHAAAQGRVEALRARIRETTAALREAERAHGVAQRRLSGRLVALYVEEPPTLVEVVLSSGGLSEAVDAQASLEAISSADGRIIASVEQARDRLARVRGELLDQREDADAALREAGARLARMDGLLRSRRAVLEQAKSTLDGLVAQERRRAEAAGARRQRDAAIDAAGRRVEEAVRDRARPGAAPAPTAPRPATAVSGRAQPGGARPHRRVRVGREPAGGVGERPVPGQVPVRPGHLGGRGRRRRPGRGAGVGAGPARGDALRAQRPGALAGVRIPVRTVESPSRWAMCPLTSWPAPNIVSVRPASRRAGGTVMLGIRAGLPWSGLGQGLCPALGLTAAAPQRRQSTPRGNGGGCRRSK